MASDELMKMLNRAIAMELQVSIQYMWQHVQWRGIEGYATHDIFKEIAIGEMKHAEAIAERLNYLGTRPTITPEPIVVGETLEAMIKQNIKDEEMAVSHYTQIIAKAEGEGDYVTSHLFRDILSDEEGHHDTFTTLLEK